MEELQKIPNVGKVLAEHLHAIGIDSVEKMKSATAETIFMRIRTQRDPGACLHMLYGIEGALQGIPKTQISAARKQELRTFFQTVS